MSLKSLCISRRASECVSLDLGEVWGLTGKRGAISITAGEVRFGSNSAVAANPPRSKYGRRHPSGGGKRRLCRKSGQCPEDCGACWNRVTSQCRCVPLRFPASQADHDLETSKAARRRPPKRSSENLCGSQKVGHAMTPRTAFAENTAHLGISSIPVAVTTRSSPPPFTVPGLQKASRSHSGSCRTRDPAGS